MNRDGSSSHVPKKNKTQRKKRKRAGQALAAASNEPPPSKFRAALIFFDEMMKRRFVNLFGNMNSPKGNSIHERNCLMAQLCSPGSIDFVFVGLAKYVVQVCKWTDSSFGEAKNAAIHAAVYYPSIKFVAIVLENKHQQQRLKIPFNLSSYGVGGSGIGCKIISQPNELLQVLDWAEDDSSGLKLASSVFGEEATAAAKNAEHGETDADVDPYAKATARILKEMSMDSKSRAKPDRAAAIVTSEIEAEAEQFRLRKKAEQEQIDIDFALAQEIEEAESWAAPSITPLRLSDASTNSHEINLDAFLGGSSTIISESAFFGSDFPRQIMFFSRRGLLGGYNEEEGGGGEVELVDVLPQRERRGFDSLRDKVARDKKAHKNDKPVSEADLKAFIFLKEQEQAEAVCAPPKSRSVDEETCIICYESAVDCTFAPCGHMCCCVKCADTQKKVNKKCPKCRKDIVFVMKLYRN